MYCRLNLFEGLYAGAVLGAAVCLPVWLQAQHNMNPWLAIPLGFLSPIAMAVVLALVFRRIDRSVRGKRQRNRRQSFGR